MKKKIMFFFLFSFLSLSAKESYIDLYNKGQYTEAIKNAKESAEKLKSSNAEFFLGKIYFYGDHIKKNLDKSKFFLMKAQKKGNKNAIFLLSKMYANGIGTKKDLKKTIKMLTSLSKRGMKEAQYELSLCYFYGNGVKVNYEKAFFWARRAALKKVSEADYLVGLMLYKGKGVSKDIKKAIAYLKLGSLYNNLDSQELLAKILIDRDKKQLNGKFSKETVKAVKVALSNGSKTLWKDWNDLDLGMYDEK